MMYFEDFHAGQTFESPRKTVDAERVRDFATEFDPQPFHLEEGAAKASVFGRVAASGWHTAAMTMRLILDTPMRIAGGNLGLGGDISWPTPTYPGDEIRVVSEVTEVRASRSKPAFGVVRVRFETRNQNDKPVQISTMTLLVPRRSADGR